MFDMPYINFRFSGNFTVDKIHVPEGGDAPTLPRKEAEDPLEGGSSDITPLRPPGAECDRLCRHPGAHRRGLAVLEPWGGDPVRGDPEETPRSGLVRRGCETVSRQGTHLYYKKRNCNIITLRGPYSEFSRNFYNSIYII